MFYADDLKPAQLEILRNYVESNGAETVKKSDLRLLSLSDFLKEFFRASYKAQSLILGFNLPFDLSRLGFDVSTARREFGGGFSLSLWSYSDKAGLHHSDPNRPRVTIKRIDSKRSWMSFTGRKEPDRIDLIPEGSTSGRPLKGHKIRGHFLDLKTLAFTLSDRAHTLKSACEAFGVERGKTQASEHGTITEEYIHYNRRDVEATAHLAAKFFEEYDRHPISLQETKAFSPASIGKAYLREMGITPILKRQQDIQQYVGYAQTAYFGGREFLETLATAPDSRLAPFPLQR